jgi:hypothetical protein
VYVTPSLDDLQQRAKVTNGRTVGEDATAHGGDAVGGQIGQGLVPQLLTDLGHRRFLLLGFLVLVFHMRETSFMAR